MSTPFFDFFLKIFPGAKNAVSPYGRAVAPLAKTAPSYPLSTRVSAVFCHSLSLSASASRPAFPYALHRLLCGYHTRQPLSINKKPRRPGILPEKRQELLEHVYLHFTASLQGRQPAAPIRPSRPESRAARFPSVRAGLEAVCRPAPRPSESIQKADGYPLWITVRRAYCLFSDSSCKASKDAIHASTDAPASRSRTIRQVLPHCSTFIPALEPNT